MSLKSAHFTFWPHPHCVQWTFVYFLWTWWSCRKRGLGVMVALSRDLTKQIFGNTMFIKTSYNSKYINTRIALFSRDDGKILSWVGLLLCNIKPTGHVWQWGRCGSGRSFFCISLYYNLLLSDGYYEHRIVALNFKWHRSILSRVRSQQTRDVEPMLF